VTGETRPQYLVLTDAVCAGPDAEQYSVMPPLRAADDRDALWDALASGVLSMVATDHCPFRKAQEQLAGSFEELPNGLAGESGGLQSGPRRISSSSIQLRNGRSMPRGFKVVRTSLRIRAGASEAGCAPPSFGAVPSLTRDVSRRGRATGGSCRARPAGELAAGLGGGISLTVSGR
jgi:hypothetical protein